jgi:hypothetical protein
VDILILVVEWEELSDDLAGVQTYYAIVLLWPEGPAKAAMLGYCSAQMVALEAAILDKYDEYTEAMDERENSVTEYEDVPCSPALDPFDPLG